MKLPSLPPLKTKVEEKEGGDEAGDISAGGKEDAGEPHSPATPAGRMFMQEKTNCYIIAILGLANPVDVGSLRAHLADTLVHHKRFSSVLRERKRGGAVWERVAVDIDNHLTIADVSPDPAALGLDPVEGYAERLASSLYNAEPVPDRPLWQVHILHHPRRGNCGGSIVFCIHHSLGDGISLMSLLLALTSQSADPTKLPTLPTPSEPPRPKSVGGKVMRLLRVIGNTVTEAHKFNMMVLSVRDDATAVKGVKGIERGPRRITCTEEISLQDINFIKEAVSPVATVNDVLMTILSAGLAKFLERRKLMDLDMGGSTTNELGLGDVTPPALSVIQEGRHEGYDQSGYSGVLGFSSALAGETTPSRQLPSSGYSTPKANGKSGQPTPKEGEQSRRPERRRWVPCGGKGMSGGRKPPPAQPKRLRVRALALVNLRPATGLQDVKNMLRKESRVPWGNKMGYLLIPLPLHPVSDPLHRLQAVQRTIRKKKLSLEAQLSYSSGAMVVKLLGVGAASSLIYRTNDQTTLAVSNMVGPQEQVALAGNDIVSITPTVVGTCLSMIIHFQSYKNYVKVVCQTAESIIPDPDVLCECISEGFYEIKSRAVKERGRAQQTMDGVEEMSGGLSPSVFLENNQVNDGAELVANSAVDQHEVNKDGVAWGDDITLANK